MIVLQITPYGARAITQLLECFSVKHGALNSFASNACNENPTTWEVEARESEIQGYPQMRTELESSLGHTRPWST